MTWGVHITLASRWLDPGETEGIATPFMVLYALHDALVKPMPAGFYTPSLAESFVQSKDGLTYDFVMRKGAVLVPAAIALWSDVPLLRHDDGAVDRLLRVRHEVSSAARESLADARRGEAFDHRVLRDARGRRSAVEVISAPDALDRLRVAPLGVLADRGPIAGSTV